VLLIRCRARSWWPARLSPTPISTTCSVRPSPGQEHPGGAAGRQGRGPRPRRQRDGAGQGRRHHQARDRHQRRGP
jgi:hypothetical protein